MQFLKKWSLYLSRLTSFLDFLTFNNFEYEINHSKNIVILRVRLTSILDAEKIYPSKFEARLLNLWIVIDNQ